MPILRIARGIKGQFKSPDIEDVVLSDFSMVAQHDAKPRLNLVLPALRSGEDFGGFDTGIDIFLRVAERLRSGSDIDLRLIITDAKQDSDPGIFFKRAGKTGVTVSENDCLILRSSHDPIEVRPNDLFMTYNWWTTTNFSHLRAKQCAMFGTKALPILYLIQDYEPNFHPFSSTNMISRDAYDRVERLWGLFNSSNLKNYFELQGHSVERDWCFEPVISDALRPYLDAVSASGRKKRIVVYGRPYVNRNCFPALIRGLQHWVEADPSQSEWKIVSAGMMHDPVSLGKGRTIRSLGKLPLEEYAQLLLESSVGVSLMASPHPSYPPLEMAHFGLRVVTNRYTCKDLAGYHPNIISLPSIAAAELSEGIARACRMTAEPPTAASNPDFVRDGKYPFIEELVEAIEDELFARSA